MSLHLISIFCFAAITGCQSLSIGDVEKKILPAGRPDQPILMQYSATASIAKTITLQAINIEDSDQKMNISIARLPDGLVMSSENPLEPGNYYISATTKYLNESLAKDVTVVFHIQEASKGTFIIKKKATVLSVFPKK
ncbi:hypothetical protein [Ulvibacter antarcticus]|uniref:Uncharacterized protein n=1 Tax=Ulvibacter antarcticus TaxID=442714 RepID=A0A3L9YAM1_9FLAO|nr:hypothetical protein [Ulvibacter antarcticus]RMA57761.1 hypothetical protein BXY75_2566 [Ulvibacter antarcticus]